MFCCVVLCCAPINGVVVARSPAMPMVVYKLPMVAVAKRSGQSVLGDVLLVV